MLLASAQPLLSLSRPERLRVLYLAEYAPAPPDFRVSGYGDDGGYPAYHHEVFRRLQSIGLQVVPSSTPDVVTHAGGRFDYVFSLFNRMPIRNSEVYVSSNCEFMRLPYLGAPPNVRALAEDKFASKLLANAAGIPVPRGVTYTRRTSFPDVTPPFDGPWFIKDRFGAGSEGITVDNCQSDWAGAREQVELLWVRGEDAVVERFIEGVDLTVAVIGDAAPRIVGIFQPLSDKPGNILTHDLKLRDHLGYVEVNVGPERALFEQDVATFWSILGPIDYFRIDYRWNPATRERRFLELNICCYIGDEGPFGIAARREGRDSTALLEHVIAFSIARQQHSGRRSIEAFATTA